MTTAVKIGVGIGITGFAAKTLRVTDPVSLLGLAMVGQALAWMPDFVSSCLKSFRPPAPVPNAPPALRFTPAHYRRIPPKLEAMPPEILTRIGGSLNPKDMAYFRSTSKTIRKLTDPFEAAVLRFEAEDKDTVTLQEIRELRKLNPRFTHTKPFKLDLSYNSNSDEELNYIVENFPNIVEIDATQGLFVLDDSSLAIIARLKHLHTLNLTTGVGGSLITDAGLAHLAHLTKLKHLNLSGNDRITHIGLAYLAGLPNLTDLNLTECTLIDDAGVAALAGLAKTLKRLNLSQNDQITDLGLASLVPLAKLKRLNLNGCGHISNAGILHLLHLQNLNELKLRKCPGITDAGLPPLAQLPKLTCLHVSVPPNSMLITPPGLASLYTLPILNIYCYNWGD
jgi:Leucine Rich Repeat (LRR) protein